LGINDSIGSVTTLIYL